MRPSRLAAGEHLAPADFASPIQASDALAGVLVDHRADVGVLVGRVADPERLDLAGRSASRNAS